MGLLSDLLVVVLILVIVLLALTIFIHLLPFLILAALVLFVVWFLFYRQGPRRSIAYKSHASLSFGCKARRLKPD